MKNKKITLIGGLVGFLVVLVTGIFIFIQSLPLIVFTNNYATVEINETFEPMTMIEKIRKGETQDIVVNTEALDVNKLGTYTVTYSILEKSYDLEVRVVDTIAPEFDVLDGETDATLPIDVNSLVANIKDATNTTVAFKENYSFDQEGDYEFVIVVSDEANNKTEKISKIHILPKDETKPVISGKNEVSLYQYANFDALSGMSVSDNQDPNVTLKVVSNTVDCSKVGTYNVTYEAVDRSGNKATFTKTVTIVEEKKTQYTGEKVVYLTFDDGPSYNTPKVLKILKQYGIQATFFVTGNASSSTRQYIKQAYDEGHVIGLHTYTHDYSKVYKSVNAYFEDLKKIDDVVYSLTGYHSPYIRFPGGSSNTISRNYCKGIMSTLAREVHARGYEYYDWNVSSADASGAKVSKEKIIKAATSASSGTVMLLFHDAGGKDTTVEALPTIIEYYLNLGYEFKGIHEDTYGFHQRIAN